MEHTLPYSWYSDPEILRREQALVFRSAWQYAGHLGQLPEPGTFFTGRAGRMPVVVTRARDGELRAFLNVCRHRGFPVAAGAGRRETLQCPYHAWTYGLDGSLRAAPRSDEDPAFCRDELGLVPAAVGTWGPFVFVNAGPEEPEPLADALGSMPAQVAELGLDVDELLCTSRWESEVEANWKIVCENFLECYHCQTAHPALAEVLDVSAEAYALSTEGRLSSQHGPIRDGGPATLRLDGELPRSQFHFLWPNLTVNIFPGPPEHLDRPRRAAHPGPQLSLPRLLLRPGRRPGLDRRADGLRRPGRPRGPGSRRGRPPRRHLAAPSSTAIS